VVIDVGANWLEVDGDDVVDTLVAFARQHHITQIVISASQRSRWQELKGGGSIVKRFTQLAAAGEIDVHIIGRHETPSEYRSRVARARCATMGLKDMQ
jgi:K+-sensing histidine kinase KdpD